MLFDDFGFFDYSADANGIYEYTSSEYTKVIHSLVGIGVVYGEGDALEITSNGLALTIKTGVCFVNGRYGNLKTSKTLTLDAAATGSKRYDLIVARATTATRQVSIEVKQGTAAGAPTLTQTEDVYEIPLYEAEITSGTASVALTDRRNIIYTPTEVMEELNKLKSGDEYIYAVYA